MLKRMTRVLALMLMASPLMIAACDKSDNKNDAAVVTTLDGGDDTDGSRVDALAVPDTLPTAPDGGTVSDTNLPSDSSDSDAIVSPDASVVVDAAKGSDVAADAVAGDATSGED